jgi:hypothetical protein
LDKADLQDILLGMTQVVLVEVTHTTCAHVPRRNGRPKKGKGTDSGRQPP